MKILTCPLNGPRPIQEFLFGGELREMPDTATVTVTVAAMPCVNFEFLSPAASWLFRAAETGQAIEVAFSPRLSVTTAEAAVEAAARGAGATRVLHYQCAEQVREGALRIMLEDFETNPIPVHLIHAARGALPWKMRVFLDYAAPVLRAKIRSL